MGSNVTLNDGLTSMTTKLGQRSESRRYSSTRRLTPNYLWNLYRSNWIVRKYVDKTAGDMLKEWRENNSSDFAAEDLAAFEKLETELKVKAIAEEALTWASLFGDAIILAITDISDEQYALPLQIESEEIRRFLVIDRRSFTLGETEKSIASDNLGNPKEFEINGNLKVHHSRVHRVRAGKQPYTEKKRQRYGESDIDPFYKTIRMFDGISTSIDDMVEESNVDVLALEGLNDQISAGQEEEVMKYAMLTKELKSSSNLMLVDSTTKYDQKQSNFGGLSEVWTKASNVLAGALDRPITVLFGQSASGFNSGEEDNKNYYDTIAALQESRLRPILDFFDKFIFDKMGKVPQDWSYKFPTIDVMNKKDHAAIFGSYATGMTTMVQGGILTESQVLKELKQRGIFENITDADIIEAESLGSSHEAGRDTREESVADTAKTLAASYSTE